jgi:DNA-directed RNA polymerase specialized sigma24 family protein
LGTVRTRLSRARQQLQHTLLKLNYMERRSN